MNINSGLKIAHNGITFDVSFVEGEWLATFRGWSAYGSTQLKAIQLCHAMMTEDLLGDDEE